MTSADKKAVKRLSKAFKALSHPNRLQLFLNLIDETQGGATMDVEGVHTCFLTSLLGNLNVGASTISHHIKELANAELIETTREGKQLSVSIDHDMVRELAAVFDFVD